MGKIYVKSEASSGQQTTATTPQIPTTEKQYGINWCKSYNARNK